MSGDRWVEIKRLMNGDFLANKTTEEIERQTDAWAAYVVGKEEQIVQERAETLEVLKRVEWEPRLYGYNCPVCFVKMDITKKHAPDCRLAALIKKLESE